MDSPIHSTGADNKAVRFVTLPINDPDFARYMNGEGADGLRSVPVETFAAHSKRERVTFALYEKEESAQDWWRGLATLARLELLPLTLGPLALGFSATAVFKDVDILKALTMVIGMTALHVAVFARNDVSDHQTGIDRIQRRRGSQVIQRGWMSVRSVRQLSHFALVIAVACAVPLLWQASVSLIALIGVGLIAVLGFSLTRGFKAKGLGDVVVVLCMGPLVTYGVGLTFGFESPLWLLAVGLPVGMAAVIVFQSRQFESILAERQIESGTLVARLGFDRTKKLLQRELLLLPVVTAICLGPYLQRAPLVVVVVILSLGQRPLAKKIVSAASPLASQLVGLGRWATWFHLGLVLVFILAMGSLR